VDVAEGGGIIAVVISALLGRFSFGVCK
jgi:hypothetical protein